MNDASTSGDVDTLAAHHLNTDKFTRFGGDRFERVGYDECIAVETAFFSAVKDLEWDMQGLKIDVFGDVAVVTVTPEFSFTLDGQAAEGATRLTLVFLKTDDGWKIVHEHGTPKSCFDQTLKSQEANDGSDSGGRSIVAADHSLDSDGVIQTAFVETVSGRLRGAVDSSVTSFKGIPFAAPPVGALRWRAPQPPQPWDGVRDASKAGPICPQFRDGETTGEEDCLYLNVWTPGQRGNQSLPVLFWIHGGGFVNGGTIDPREDGATLAREGMVVVTTNYRLGRFGFFAHPALTAANADQGRLGNYGIMDQIAALEWVRDNIASFGGDPENVTVAGESAGGISVNHLMTAPIARGLFARGIVQSGGGRNNLVPFRNLKTNGNGRLSAESHGVSFASAHGIEGDGHEALSALRTLPAEEVVDGLNMGTISEQQFGGPIGDGVVLPSHFEEVYRTGREQPVPLIVGATDADGFYAFFGGTREEIFAPFGAFRTEAEAVYGRAGEGRLRRTGTYASADRLFIEPARHIARLHAANGYPTWQFRFSYVPEHLRDERVGAIHSSDIQFVFGTIASFFKPTPNDQQATDTMRAYWRSFINDGTPNPEGLPAWPRYVAEDDVILDFRNEGPTVGPDPARERLDFAERVAESGHNDKYFDSAGVRIRYIDVGPRDGEPVVLIHGFSQRIESAWVDTGVIEALDDEYRVIALDWRGHGKSDTPHDPAMYGPVVADDIIRLLDHLKIDKAHVVGYSMGGHITFRLLADHPDRIISAMPCADGGVHFPARFVEVAERTVTLLRASGSIRPLIDYFAFPDLWTENQIDEIVATQRNANDVEALADVLPRFRALDADPAKLADNIVPCLAIMGEHDPFLPGLELTAQNMPNLEVEVINGHDHISALKAPEFLETMARFLAAQSKGAAERPTVHIEYQERLDDTGGSPYVFAEGTMSGTVRGTGSYSIPIQIHYPTEGGNGTAVLELTNSALLYFRLEARGDIAGDRRSDADDIDELEGMLVNFGWAGAREYLLRNGYTHMAIQYSKMVTDFMGEAPPEGRTQRHLCYGRIERATDAYQIIRDAARWLADPSAMDGDAPAVPAHDHVIAYGLSGTGYLLRDYLMRGKNAGGEIDGFFLHAAGSQCLTMIDDTADCPQGSICLGSPRFSNYFTCPGPPPTNGARVFAVDAQTDLEFNLGALAREKAVDDPNYVRWEVAGAPHVPVFAMDLTRLGAPHQNPMDWSPIWRSAFYYLDRWVKQGTPPPTAPPIEGTIVATDGGDAWRPALDADGNALGGLRLPQIEVPKGVYVGFDFSWLDPAISKGHEFSSVFGYGGRFEPFSDETLSKRYPTKADYKKAFEAAAQRAFDAGYILEEDLRRYTAAPMPVVGSDAANDDFEDQYFDSGGVRIRYIDVGPRDGEAIVLVTPPAQSIEDAWVTTGILDALDDEYRVVGVDPRGQGKSDKPHDPAAYGNAWVDDIVRLLDNLRIDRAHLAGYSGSGRTVFKLVADHPDRVISALPCGTSAEPLTPEGVALFERLADSLEKSGSMRPVFEHFNVDGTWTDAQIKKAVEMVRANNDTKALAAAAHTVQDLIPDRTRLERNTVPCLCIIGAGDPNLAPARKTATYMPGLEIHAIEGANHLTAFRHPEFLDAMKSFIAAHKGNN